LRQAVDQGFDGNESWKLLGKTLKPETAPAAAAVPKKG
jgi:hypothetical protein